MERFQYMVLFFLRCQHSVHHDDGHMANSPLLEHRCGGAVLPVLAVARQMNPRKDNKAAYCCNHFMCNVAHMQMGYLPRLGNHDNLQVSRRHKVRLHDDRSYWSHTFLYPEWVVQPISQQQNNWRSMPVGAVLFTDMGWFRSDSGKDTGHCPAGAGVHHESIAHTNHQFRKQVMRPCREDFLWNLCNTSIVNLRYLVPLQKRRHPAPGNSCSNTYLLHDYCRNNPCCLAVLPFLRKSVPAIEEPLCHRA